MDVDRRRHVDRQRAGKVQSGRRRPRKVQWRRCRPSMSTVDVDGQRLYNKKIVFLNSEKNEKKIIFQNLDFLRYFWQ